jgi:hypothetical protein
MVEPKVPSESGNSTEDGDTLVETEGLERDRNDKGGMRRVKGAMQVMGVMQGAGVVWVRVWVGEFAWVGVLPLPVQQLCTLEHWRQQSAHWALCICPIALQLHMGCYRWRTYS